MRGLTCRRTEVEVRRRYLGAELVRAQVGGCLPASSQLYRILRVSPGFLRRTRDPPVLYDRACSAVAYVTGDADQGMRWTATANRHDLCDSRMKAGSPSLDGAKGHLQTPSK